MYGFGVGKNNNIKNYLGDVVYRHHVAPSTLAGDQGLVRSARAQALFLTRDEYVKPLIGED